MAVVLLDNMPKIRLTQWLTFLEEESARQGGLLFFYDLQKSQKVLFFCRMLAARFEELINEAG
jgi:hypothetical protein